jgi:hypothetical protein
VRWDCPRASLPPERCVVRVSAGARGDGCVDCSARQHGWLQCGLQRGLQCCCTEEGGGSGRVVVWGWRGVALARSPDGPGCRAAAPPRRCAAAPLRHCAAAPLCHCARSEHCKAAASLLARCSNCSFRVAANLPTCALRLLRCCSTTRSSGRARYAGRCSTCCATRLRASRSVTQPPPLVPLVHCRGTATTNHHPPRGHAATPPFPSHDAHAATPPRHSTQRQRPPVPASASQFLADACAVMLRLALVSRSPFPPG